jgi:hypothetical protein
MRILFLVLSTLSTVVAVLILGLMSFDFLPEQKESLAEVQQMSTGLEDMGVSAFSEELNDLPSEGFISALTYIGVILIIAVIATLIMVYVKKRTTIPLLVTVGIVLFFGYGVQKLSFNPLFSFLLVVIPVVLFALFAFLAQNATKKKELTA